MKASVRMCETVYVCSSRYILLKRLPQATILLKYQHFKALLFCICFYVFLEIHTKTLCLNFSHSNFMELNFIQLNGGLFCCSVYSFSHITITLSLVFCSLFFNIHLWHSNISTLYDGEQNRLMRARTRVCVCICFM